MAQKCPHPGQQPAVQNVFQRVKQPAPGSEGAQHHRLFPLGSHLHSGQWIWGCGSMRCRSMGSR
jgi:hypothetical protein